MGDQKSTITGFSAVCTSAWKVLRLVLFICFPFYLLYGKGIIYSHFPFHLFWYVHSSGYSACVSESVWAVLNAKHRRFHICQRTSRRTIKGESGGEAYLRVTCNPCFQFPASDGQALAHCRGSKLLTHSIIRIVGISLSGCQLFSWLSLAVREQDFSNGGFFGEHFDQHVVDIARSSIDAIDSLFQHIAKSCNGFEFKLGPFCVSHRRKSLATNLKELDDIGHRMFPFRGSFRKDRSLCFGTLHHTPESRFHSGHEFFQNVDDLFVT